MKDYIDAAAFKEMILCADAALRTNIQQINELNVFPVPDGDTGTNMCLTLSNAATELRKRSFVSVDKAADCVSSALLRGARGNSGVILSLLFRGIAKRLKGTETAGPVEFAGAMSDGVDAAYKAVMKPAEGTILTVSRLASAAAVEAAEQAALAFEQAMYKFETHRALAVCDDYLRAANKRWSDASKAANKLEGEPANAAMTQALVDAFTELRVATVLMHGIVPAGCELICEYFDVDPVAFFSWDNIFASTDEFVESLGEKPGEHRVKPLPPRFDFFSKHESQY